MSSPTDYPQPATVGGIIPRDTHVSLLTAAERHQLLVEWNSTAADYPREQCLHQVFEAQVARTPDAIALLFQDSQLTYRQLNSQANQLAHSLQALGVGPEVLVGVCMERSLQMVIALLAILKAGGAYVPLDPTYPRERLAYMLQDASISIALIQSRFQSLLPDQSMQIICLDAVDAEIPLARKDDNPISSVQPDNLIYMIYTSGSTGRPKGVMNIHRGLTNRLHWMQQAYQLTPADRVLQKTPFSFDVSVWEFFWPLCTGARLIMAQPAGHQDPTYLRALIAQQQITTLHFVPSMLQSFLMEQHLAQCASLKRVICSGEDLSFQLQQRFFSRFNITELHNLYGPTEASIDVLFWQCQRESQHRTVPIGRPIANTCIYILDQSMRLVPLGVPGELYLGGIGVARGYFNRPELTAEKFVPNPFSGAFAHSDPIVGADLSRASPIYRPCVSSTDFPNAPFSSELGARLYKTGDLARYLPDGTIEFLGRIDYQVKLRGFRIELGEIETVLDTHPAIQQAIVLAREDTPGDKRLVAYLLPRAPASPTISELRDFLKQRLPDYMLPSAFVLLESLPLTSNGKLDRLALPIPDPTRQGLGEAFVAPRSPLEELVAGSWSQVLGIEQLGIHDDFFALGGHSLLAMQVISRLRSLVQVEVPLRSFFEAPTVAQLTGLITRWKSQGLSLHLPTIQARSREAQRVPPSSIPSLMHQTMTTLPAEIAPTAPTLQVFPASFAQQRLWFLDQLEPQSAAYNLPASLRLNMALDVAALEQSLNALIERHEVLRTTFAAVDGHPMQVIAPALALSLPLLDLSALSETAREAEALRLANKQAQHPFDLVRGPLLRTTLLKLAAQEYILLLTIHHIISDGWSIGVLFQELTTLYTALASGQPSPLPDLPIQYVDYSLWQQEQMQADMLAGQLTYWKQHVAGAPATLDLPTDRPRPAVPTSHGSIYFLTLPRELTEALKILSRQQGVTLYMLLVAAFQTLLHRYSGQEDLVLGTFTAGRTQAETEPLIGFFVNTLLLRTDLSGNPTFRDLLGRVREVVLEAYAHQELPFDLLVRDLQPTRTLGQNPLFQVLLTLLPPLPSLPAGWEPYRQAMAVETGATRFDLSLELDDRPEGLACRFEYSTDLFDASTIARMAGHWQTLLQGIVADPSQPLAALPLLTGQERQQVLIEWNDTPLDYPRDACLHQLFEAQVERAPDAVALVYEDECLTYRQLNSQANQLAHYLRQLGVGPEALVGICVERSLEMLVALLGILKAGGAYVPLDPAYPTERLAFMLHDAQVAVLLTQQRLLERLPLHEARVVCLDADAEVLTRESKTNLATITNSNHLAYVIYTSGSTGRPKGVQILHRAVVNFLTAMRQQPGLMAQDSLLAVTTLSFDIAALELFLPLLVGARLIIASRDVVTSGSALAQELASTGATVMQATPVTWRMLLSAGWQGNPHLKILCGGEALSLDLAQQLLPKSASLYNLYGPTETTIWSAICKIEPEDASVSIGRPILNTSMYILDAHLQLLPIGVSGDLYIGGAGLARGYFNRPALTAEKFVPHPFSSEAGARLYKTGDLARYLPDGTIELLGRIDTQVKLRGFRIELGEIEAVLVNHSAVRQAVVVAREDIPGDKRLVAYVVPQLQDISTNDLRGHLKTKLPDFMLPSAFVLLEALPLTPNGKLDRRALPAPDYKRSELECFVAPRTPLEEIVADIWSQVLGIKRVGVHDDFFALGGHSLLAMQVTSRLRMLLHIEVPLRSFFETPTVAQLAEAVTQLKAHAATVYKPLLRPRSREAYRAFDSSMRPQQSVSSRNQQAEG